MIIINDNLFIAISLERLLIKIIIFSHKRDRFNFRIFNKMDFAETNIFATLDADSAIGTISVTTAIDTRTDPIRTIACFIILRIRLILS